MQDEQRADGASGEHRDHREDAPDQPGSAVVLGAHVGGDAGEGHGEHGPAQAQAQAGMG